MTAEPLPEGAKAPSFELEADNGTIVRLADLKGRWVVVFFYPKALTPGCTTEACGFSDLYGQIEALGAEVLGISHDPVERQRRFKEKHGLSLTLLADPEHRATEAFGVYGLKKFMGREHMGIHRMTFLVDPEGEIAKVWRKVRVKDHPAEVLEELRSRLAG